MDRLLASPHYGERWGRYLARHRPLRRHQGRHQTEPGRAQYPFAWTYRDYVVRSFNEDKPYNRFILEQIAGRQTARQPKTTSELAALGFLTLGRVSRTTSTTSSTTALTWFAKASLGLTVTCARCHDHKFDPIPTRIIIPCTAYLTVASEPAEEPIIGRRSDQTPRVHRLLRQNRQRPEPGSWPSGAGAKGEPQGTKRETGRNCAKRTTRFAARRATGTDRPRLARRAPRSCRTATKPHDSPVFIRGEAENKGEIVPRQFLEILSGPTARLSATAAGGWNWPRPSSSPDNPLTARVLVNRVWLHHFGEGIVHHPGRFRQPVRSAQPSGIAGLSCRAVYARTAGPSRNCTA